VDVSALLTIHRHYHSEMSAGFCALTVVDAHARAPLTDIGIVRSVLCIMIAPRAFRAL